MNDEELGQPENTTKLDVQRTQDKTEQKQSEPPIKTEDTSRRTSRPPTPLIVESTGQLVGVAITFPQLLNAIAVSLISLVIGFATAYTSQSDASLRRDLNIGSSEMSWIGSLMPLNAVFGGLLGFGSIEYCGRKGTLLIISIIFLISWILIYCSENFYEVCMGRCFAGISIGLASLTLPIYLIETVQVEVRGTIGLLPMTFGNIGILLSFAYGMFVDWRDLAAIGAMISLPFPLFLLWVIPETPKWYVSNDKLDKCKRTLEWLRSDMQDIMREFEFLVRQHNEHKSQGRRISKLLEQPNLKFLIIILSLMFLQQFSGINAVIFYTTSIFNQSGSQFSPTICTTMIGTVNMISSFLSNGLIDRIGRKLSLQVSSIFMTLGLGCLGFYYYAREILDVDVEDFGYIPLSSLMIFVTAFSLGFGPVPWLLMGELLPVDVRGVANAMATALNWACTFLITLTFLTMAEMFGYFAVFWFYCCMVLTAGVLTWLFVPGSDGRTWADVGRELSVANVRRTRAAANTKPFPSPNM